MNQKTSSSTSNARIAIVSAAWHSDIVGQARESIISELQYNQAAPAMDVEEFDVPGAYEIPLHAQLLAKSGRFDAIIACGLVVDGGIYRHDFVAHAVIDGLMRVQLDTEVPVFSVVLTPHQFHETEEHRQFFTDHFVKKGIEAARACQQTLTSLRTLKG